MVRFFICFLLLSICNQLYCQAINFGSPLEGTSKRDYYIDYYCDHDTGRGISDPFCGNKTYDGHKGTDYLLKDFKAMDSGAFVCAVADGFVSDWHDGEYDRSKHWVAGGLGNYIKIHHADGYYTYYGHLMKNSVLVKTGDYVKKGQRIGKVGSSGYSCYPHLHLEVRKDGVIVDPFNSCYGGSEIKWDRKEEYDTAVYVIKSGFVPYVPGYDTLLEGYQVRDTFDIRTDTTICFWALVHGLKKGDIIHTEWYKPKNGRLYSTFDYQWQYNLWHDYSWTFIKMPSKKGMWEVRYFINNKVAAHNFFYVK